MEKYLINKGYWNQKRLVLLIMLNLIFTFSHVKGENFSVKNFSKEHYAAQYQNWSSSIGPDGMLFVANNAGLLVYDGVIWDFYTHANITNVRAVKADSISGRIYTAGYREMGFWEWDSVGELHYHSLTPLVQDDLIKNEEFWNIVISSDSIVFQSFTGIFIYHDEEFEIIRPNEFINSINRVNNKILLHLLNDGIFVLENGKAKPFLVDDMLQDKMIRFIISPGKDSLLIGTAQNGLFLYDGYRVKPFLEEYFEYFQTNTINRGVMLSQRQFAVGTILDGIIVLSLDGEKNFHINDEKGLQNNTILDINVIENGIWISLDRGISYIQYEHDPSFEVHTVEKIGAVYSGAVYKNKFYLGTNQGLYSRYLHEDDKNFELIPGTQGQVWECKTIDDRLFVGHNSGTFVITESGLEKISEVSGGFCIINNPFKQNTLIQSTYSNLVYFEKNNGEWNISHVIGNFFDLIRFIELDHLNNLWASHMRRGIFKLTFNDNQDSVRQIRYYGENSVFNQEYGIHVFGLENRIVFTTGKKIYTYDDIHDTIISYDELNENIGRYASAHRIVDAGNHYYWFITRSHAALFQFALDEVIFIREYPLDLFGYHIIEGYENIIPLSSRTGVLCLENGYAFLHTDTTDNKHEIENTTLFPRVIAVHNRNRKEQRLPLDKSNYRIPFAKNNLRLQYAFPYFTTGNIKYKYYIEGLDERWSEPKESPVFEIDRIPAGDYVVRVVAMNEWEQESKPYSLMLKVLPPWYNSVFAWIVYVLVTLVLIGLIRHLSVQKIKRKEKKKRELKERELMQLRNQNLQNELSFKSRELANSTMAIINKNEFLMKLKNMLKRQKQDLGTRYPDKYFQQVVRKIDTNISGGDDWKIFETNIEQAHEQFIQQLIHDYPQLSHSDLRLCTYLRMNLTSKEIAPLMRISLRGVENHRYRIRKKLGLSTDENLTDFILAYQVI